jgi:hypothetical protein
LGGDPECPGVPHVQKAGGRRGKTASIGS